MNSFDYEDAMVVDRSWEEFRASGLLWFINTILHLFGWSIVYYYDEGDQLTSVCPTRVKFRGFTNELNSEGYRKVTKFLKDNIDELEKETRDETCEE